MLDSDVVVYQRVAIQILICLCIFFACSWRIVIYDRNFYKNLCGRFSKNNEALIEFAVKKDKEWYNLFCSYTFQDVAMFIKYNNDEHFEDVCLRVVAIKEEDQPFGHKVFIRFGEDDNLVELQLNGTKIDNYYKEVWKAYRKHKMKKNGFF